MRGGGVTCLEIPFVLLAGVSVFLSKNASPPGHHVGTPRGAGAEKVAEHSKLKSERPSPDSKFMFQSECDFIFLGEFLLGPESEFGP